MIQENETDDLYIHRVYKEIGERFVLQQIYWALDEDHEIFIHGITLHLIVDGKISPNIVVNGSALSEEQTEEAKNYLIKYNVVDAYKI